ncbi:A24 family peptidase [Novosphingobium mathurense]|uniref:Prepilin peptidase CpaA n=1 Tax=Novosphingobium mathurense TaxID=428990 RepID=A0A1U6GYY2_9SPHN|nr:prepilin peptidase [Novosphingobium mathurense]SLJ88749.1 prepilin peptidase CpaA [Novosphingobium mathurense]
MNVTFWAELVVLVPACFYASWSDTVQRRIPNWLCLLTAVAGLALAAYDAGLGGLGSHALHLAVALVVGMVLFRFGMIGGGDAKFYAGCAGWFAWSQASRLLLSVSIAGLVLFLVWFTVRRIMRKPISGRGSDDNFDKLPYGIAIAAGTLITAASTI